MSAAGTGRRPSKTAMNIEPTGTQTAATGAIRQAARMTGADFKYLLATAQVESNLNPNAQAPSSSAKGLFQFIEQTWLSTLKEQGTSLGYAPYANAISRQASGQYSVSDPRMYDRIMDLRADPTANALMAGAYTRANAGKLSERFGRNPSEGELYIAHFLGPNGAMRLIDLAESRPYTPAAALFPGPARANPSIFFDGRGNARGAKDVYKTLLGRYGVARGAPATNTATQPATAQARPNMRPVVLPDDPAQAAANQQQPAPPAKAADNGPMFYGLFRSGGEGEQVAPVVNALWGTPPAAPTPQVQAPETPATAYAPVAPVPSVPTPSVPARRPQPLDLFQDQPTDARALFRGRV